MSMPAEHLKPTLTLDRLLEGLLDGTARAPAVEITGVASDSRAVAPGNVFLACAGASRHGLEFMDEVIAAGAAAIAWDSDTAKSEPPRTAVPTVPVPRLQHRLGDIANRWFDMPSRRLSVSGVTGTNGKTTVAFLVAQCLRGLAGRCAYLGTLGAGLEPPFADVGLTTPPCIELHRRLADFVKARATHAALEVSSHALAQNRMDGVYVDSAMFTNLSRDHIDYHGDMRAYGDVKARLFLEHEVTHRIVNVDTGFGRELIERCRAAGKGGLVAVSANPRNALYAGPGARRVQVRASEPDGSGFRVELDTSWGSGACRIPLAGDFNVANAALALAQLLCWKLSFGEAVAALAACEPPPGRLQRVETGAGAPAPAVYIDYAHTPAGLEAVLNALRPHCAGKLWCVFGCGGDRDRGKRPLMGAAAARLADRAIVTTDNPRHEDPDVIIAEVLAGMDGRAAAVVAIADRARAIRRAICEARDDDVILVAGKGHEHVQVVGDERFPFSDYDVARDGLLARQDGGGP